MLLDFGKHKGKNIEDVPLEYIIFLAGYRLQAYKREECELEACKWVKINKQSIQQYANNYLQGRCWHCGRKLVPIGQTRVNVAGHEDWDDRYLHKWCWR
jgi:hypothetical protein